MTSSSPNNHFSLRRYGNNNNGGVVRNDTQNGEDGPPAYTSIPVPPPAYAPDQPPSNRARIDSDGSQEPVHDERNGDTTTRRDEGATEEGKEPEDTN